MPHSVVTLWAVQSWHVVVTNIPFISSCAITVYTLQCTYMWNCSKAKAIAIKKIINSWIKIKDSFQLTSIEKAGSAWVKTWLNFCSDHKSLATSTVHATCHLSCSWKSKKTMLTHYCTVLSCSQFLMEWTDFQRVPTPSCLIHLSTTQG